MLSVADVLPAEEVIAEGKSPARAITRLLLTNFRSYSALSLETGPQCVVLTGPNGAGKTNILEALSVLAPGRGLRGAQLGDLARQADNTVQQGQQPWAVSAQVTAHGVETQIGAGFMPGSAGSVAKRVIRVDGETASSPATLAHHVQFVWLTPAQDRLFTDGASDRRRFFDRLITSFHPLHADRYSRFEKAMRERLSLLRSGHYSAVWVESLERTLAEEAVALAASRLEGLGLLRAALAETDGQSAFPDADVALDGNVELSLESMPALAAEDAFAQCLKSNRTQDAESGRTHSGPHLTDLIVYHRAKGREARHCSTGEQKALLIRMIFAAAAQASRRTGAAPVLLLDEIAAHLDLQRRQALFGAITNLGAQAWFTGTDHRPFEPLLPQAQIFDVSHGSVSKTHHLHRGQKI